MSAYIRALPPTDAPFGRDMECVRCVACARTRQWCAFFLFRSFVPIGIVSKTRTTCCQVCMYRVGAWTPCFSCAVVSRSTNLPLDLLCRNKNAHMAPVVKKWLMCGFPLLGHVGWHVGV